MTSDKNTLRLRLVIMNGILAVMAIVSIIMLAFTPFFSFNLGLKLDADSFSQIIPSTEGEMPFDVKEVLGEDGIDINLSIFITPNMLFKSFTEKPEEITAVIITGNIDKMIKDLTPVLSQFVSSAAKEIAKTTIKEAMQENITGGAEEYLNALTEAGVNIDDSVDAIFEAFTADDANVSNFVDVIYEQIDTIANVLENAGKLEDGFELPDKAELKEELKEVLTEIGMADANGNILPIADAIPAIIAKLNEAPNGGMANANINKGFSAIAFDSKPAPETPASMEDAIRDLLSDKIPSDIGSKLSIGLKGICAVLLYFILTWAWVLIWAVLKSLLSKNPAIFTGFFCFISALLQVLIGVVLILGANIAISILPTIVDLPAELSSFNLTIGLASSVTVPGILLLCKFILNFFYGAHKRQLKRINKQEKKQARA